MCLTQPCFPYPLTCPFPINVQSDDQFSTKFQADAGSPNHQPLSDYEPREITLQQRRKNCEFNSTPIGTKASTRGRHYACPKYRRNHQLALTQLCHEAHTTSEAASAPRNCSGFLPTPSGTCFSSDSLQAQEIWSSRDSAQLILNQFGAQQASHHPSCPAAVSPVGFAVRCQHSSLVPLPPPEEKLLVLLSTLSFPQSSLDFAGGEGQMHRGTFWW